MNIKFGFGLCALLFATALVVGCGRADGFQRTIVAGSVTYDGKPIPKGAIWFVPTESIGSQAPTGFALIKDGQYATAANKAPISGVYTLKITGFDGAEPTAAEKAELLNSDFLGHALFPEFTQETQISDATMMLDIDVPKSRTKSRR